MDETCDVLLNEILEEVKNTFISRRANYRRNGINSDYIDELGKLTNILMSVKTGLALSNQPVFPIVPDFSKEESV